MVKAVYSRQEILKILEFQKDIGIDILVGNQPLNKLNLKEEVLPMPTQKKESQVMEDLFPKETISENTPLLSLQEAIQQAQEMAQKAQTLEDLRANFESFEACDLKKTATNFVFADGNPQSRVMVIGEAPGADEDRQGLPFVGVSGQLLDRAFATVGLNRTSLYISNIIPWRPPGNRQPTTQETAMCLPFIQRHIELIAPEFLVLAGGTAAKAILKTTEGIVKLRGKWQPYQTPGLKKPIQALAIFHPAYLLRSPGQKKFVWLDLLNLKQKLAQS